MITLRCAMLTFEMYSLIIIIIIIIHVAVLQPRNYKTVQIEFITVIAHCQTHLKTFDDNNTQRLISLNKQQLVITSK